MKRLIKIVGAMAVYASGTSIIQEPIDEEAMDVLKYYNKLPSNQT